VRRVVSRCGRSPTGGRYIAVPGDRRGLMQFGVTVGNFGSYGDDPGVDGCLALAEEAERLGFDSVWVNDHVVMPSGVTSRYLYNETGASPFRVDQHIYDPLAVMAAIGARTARVRIGTSVLVVPYRNPLVLAKQLSTIDRISHGRVVLGIGVGWMREEFDALGLSHLWDDRGAVTDEFIAVCIDLWTQQGPSSFEGRWVSYRDVGALPLPAQRPHIPVWVGGKTQPALRRVARYGNGYHGVGSTPSQLQQELETVRSEMDRVGRDPAALEVSMLWAFLDVTGSSALVDTLGEYADAGLQHLVGVPWVDGPPARGISPHDHLSVAMENLSRFAEQVMPALR
jgi:probable F420-dependent oxidoreductase